MPFGFKNASSTFQEAMDIVLLNVKWKFALVYFEDIVVFSRFGEERFDPETGSTAVTAQIWRIVEVE